LKKVTSIDATMTMGMQGMTMNLNEKKMAPNKNVETITMNNNVVMKSVFDGNKGYEQQGGNKKDLTADEIAQKRFSTRLNRST